MKAKNLFTGLFAVCVLGAVSLGLTACASQQANGHTGGVAATVNGQEIPEDKVTDFVEKVRQENNLTDKDQWGKWLAKTNSTPESVRKEVIDYFVAEKLRHQAAKENGIKVDDKKVDEIVSKMKSHYDNDEAWKKALEDAHTTEKDYRESVENTLLQQELAEKVANPGDPSAEELNQAVVSFAGAYNNARRSSHILFDAKDKDKAEEVLKELKEGKISFEDAAKKYSKDSTSAERGGDVGWDKLSNFVPAYTEALEKLNKDQLSDLVTSDYGIHIIKCTDVYNEPAQITEIGQLPQDFQEAIKNQVTQGKRAQAMEKWAKEYHDKADIKVNDMPEKVPYNVDMKKYQDEVAQEREQLQAVQPGENGAAPAPEGSDTKPAEQDKQADNKAEQK